MELTQKEQKLVEEYRRLEAVKEENTKQTIKALQIAADYLKWLHETGTESSFSTFTDKYGYFASKEFYEMIMNLIELAYKAVRKINL